MGCFNDASPNLGPVFTALLLRPALTSVLTTAISCTAASVASIAACVNVLYLGHLLYCMLL